MPDDLTAARERRWYRLLTGKVDPAALEEAKRIQAEGLGEIYALRADWREAIAIVGKVSEMEEHGGDLGQCAFCGLLAITIPTHTKDCPWVASRRLMGHEVNDYSEDA